MNCICDFCIHCKVIPETRWEPAEDYCELNSENYGTDDGCYEYEEDSGPDPDREYEEWREEQLERMIKE